MTHGEAYNSIIDFRKSNPLPEGQYCEKHHIVPRSVCPILKDAKANIVRLTAREHFLAHYHLWKAYRDELREKKWAKSMCLAFHFMKRSIMQSTDMEEMSKLYEEVRIEFSKNQTGVKNPQYGKHPQRTPEQRKHYSESKRGSKNPMYGRTLSDEHRRKISESNKGRTGYWNGKTQPKDVVERRVAKCLGQKRSEITRERISASLKGLRWFTNGEINSYSRECPEGFWAGMTRKSKNGIIKFK